MVKMGDKPYDSTQFTYKEKLRKCILEWRSCVSCPFNSSEASKWIESYFKRSGNSVRTVKPLLDFIITMELITIMEPNKSPKYFFNGERINQFFGTEISPSNSSRENRSPKSNCSGISCDQQIEDLGAMSSFERVISRLNDLLDMQQGMLLEYLKEQCVGEGVKSESKTGAPVDYVDERLFQKFSIRSGLSITRNRNTVDSENWKEIASTQNQLIDPVSMACLKELARWPNDIIHNSELCKDNCLPHRILSASLQCLVKREFIGTWIPTPIKLIFGLISSHWSRYGRNSGDGTASSTGGNSIFQGSPPHVTDKLAVQAVYNPCLPPLATPLGNQSIPFVDDSCHLTAAARRRPLPPPRSMETRTTAHNMFDSSGSTYGEVTPFTPLASMFKKLFACSDQSTPTKPCLESPKATVWHTHMQKPEYCKPLRACSPKPTNVDCLSHQFNAINLSSSLKSDLELKPVASAPSFANSNCIEDTINEAVHLALLLLPPGDFVRLHLLLDTLHRMLSNHQHLVDPLLLILSEVPQTNSDLCYCADGEKINGEDSEETLLALLSRLFTPLLFGIPESMDTAGWFNQKSSLPFRQIFRNLLRQTDWNFTDFQLKKTYTNAIGQHAENRCSADLSLSPRLAAYSSRQQLKEIPLPMCIASVASAVLNTADAYQRNTPITEASYTRVRHPKCANNKSISSVKNCPNAGHRLTSTPRAGDGASNVHRSRSTECSPTTSADGLVPCSCPLCSSELTATGWWRRPGARERVPSGMSASSSVAGCRSLSCQDRSSDSSVDVERVNSLGNTVHLIKLLNQIINDRLMEPRKKLRCLLQFRKTHADVYWLRFGDQQTEEMYLAQLNRRIHLKSQPNVINRITTALRRIQNGKEA